MNCNIDQNRYNQDFVEMIGYAIKAPSGHNTQPWKFNINEKSIEILPNYTKSLPVVDPDNRELFISLGCAAENLCISATSKAYDSKVCIADNGVIAIDLRKNELVKCDPLFDQITLRQTNRSVYNGRIISSDVLDTLKNITIEAGINIYFYGNGTEEFASISDFVVRGNVVQMQNRKFTDELKSWMRFNKKHQDKTNDGLSYAVFGAPNLPMFIVKPIMSCYLNDKTQNKGDIKKMQSSSHFVLFTSDDNTPEQWVNLGRTMERFLLKSTEAGIAHTYMNQPNEVKELSMEMTGILHLSAYPTTLLRIGYGETQPYSKRLSIENVIE